MYEAEIKILEIDRKATEEKLCSLGAQKIFDGEIHALYYDFPDETIRKKEGVLRLRREGEKAVVTYKSSVEDPYAKVREEREVEVSDFDVMAGILESIGLSPRLEMKKHRTTYASGEVHFELDKYHGSYEYIPEFLEIQGPDTETVYRYAGLLGFRKHDCKPWDAVEVAKYYSPQNKTVR